MHFLNKLKNSPSAALNRNASPSLQNTSHTLEATSRGNDLLNNVNVLQGFIQTNCNHGLQT